jgi:hypothetical protein
MDSGLRKYSNLDILRSVICSIARSDSSSQLKKNHILKIENLAKIFGFEGDCISVMEQLSDLREIQKLGNGYWLSAPSRSVPLNDEYLIISPLPTSHLPSEIDLQSGIGLGRLAKVALPSEPIQSIEDWMGSPRSLRFWIEGELSKAEKSLVRTVLRRENLEFYVPWAKDPSLKLSMKNWLGSSDMPLSSKGGILLARATDGIVTSYYWCAFKDGILFESQNSVESTEIIRIQYALEILNNAAWRELSLVENKDQLSFKCRFPLPSDVDRFLIAIGVRKLLEKGFQYSIQSKHLDLLVAIFSKIHIKFR